MPDPAILCLSGLGANPVRARPVEKETRECFALIFLTGKLDIRFEEECSRNHVRLQLKSSTQNARGRITFQ
jgi:hypothetical protein